MRRRYLLLLPSMALILLLTISACGRKGDPRPPDRITKNQMQGQGERVMGKDFEMVAL